MSTWEQSWFQGRIQKSDSCFLLPIYISCDVTETPLCPALITLVAVSFCIYVSAGAKIPIVPVEFSPPLNVVNRSPLHTEEVPKLVKGERRARTKRTATARDEHPDDQQADRLGPQDHSQVYEGGGGGAGIWPTLSTTEQTRCV